MKEKIRLNYGRRFGDKDAEVEEAYFDFTMEHNGDRKGLFYDGDWESVPESVRAEAEKAFKYTKLVFGIYD